MYSDRNERGNFKTRRFVSELRRAPEASRKNSTLEGMGNCQTAKSHKDFSVDFTNTKLDTDLNIM